MIRQHTHPPASPPTRSPSRSRASTLKDYVVRGRWWLLGIGLVMIAIIVISIAFTAHAYYVGFGGQGWLWSRNLHQEIDTVNHPRLYLPLRKIQLYDDQSLSLDRRGGNVPFYACGDQQNSCETYGQENICCPVQMTCYAASFMKSGIYCCNSTINPFKCEATEAHPPKCMESLVECSEETGGGCCPSALECSPNGCIHVRNASTIIPPSAQMTTASRSILTPPSMTGTNVPITVTETIWQAPAATVTLAKEGEIAQVGVGAEGSSIVVRLWIPYSTAIFMVCLAALMQRL